MFGYVDLGCQFRNRFWSDLYPTRWGYWHPYFNGFEFCDD